MIFEVDRQDFRNTRLADPPPRALEDGQVRLEVERFAFTSNNVSYAVAGDLLDYWGFFPAESPWGRIPAIGLGTIVESAHPEVPTGGRYFGFYPMGSDVVVTAGLQGPHGFRDIAPHRRAHATAYTDFRDISADETFDVEHVDEYLLLFGMFMTSFLVDDSLGERNFEGASATLVTSASSKTSIALATCLAARTEIESVGMTSERNRDFAESLGLYDRVITYDEIDQLDSNVPIGVVDMAGNADVRARIHRHCSQLAFSISVGGTHWESSSLDAGGGGDLPGPTPEFFFAPAQAAKRNQEWGPIEFQNRLATAYQALVDHSGGWLQVEYRQGPDGIEATYRDLLEGRSDPSSGFICSMHTRDLGGSEVPG